MGESRNPEIKKAYRIMPPPDVLADPARLRVWRPKQLTVREGIAESPAPVLAGYAVIIVLSIIFYASAWIRLPAFIEVTQFFGMSTAVYSKAVFLIVAFAIQIFFIYRDLIRRSISKILLLVPLLYFFLVVFLVSAL